MELTQTTQAAMHTLDVFGQYGGLVGLVIGALFIMLFGVVIISSISRDRQIKRQDDQIEKFAQAIAAQTKDITEAIRDGIEGQATNFLHSLETIRADHRADRDRDRTEREMLFLTVKELAVEKGGSKKPQSARAKLTRACKPMQKVLS